MPAGAPFKEIKKQRNNFTLSEKAQAIIDSKPKSKKSGFVSEAIVEKSENDKQDNHVDDKLH